MKVEEIVREGYKSLARKTMEAYDGCTPLNCVRNSKYKGDLKEYRQMLRDIRMNGSVRIDIERRKFNCDTVNGLIEIVIPRQYKPDSVQRTFDMAAASVQVYAQYASIDEMMQKNHITGYAQANDRGTAPIADIDGKRFKEIRFPYHENIPMLSLITATHETWHCLQKEENEIFAILDGVTQISGYEAFLKHVWRDQNLSNLMVSVAHTSHMLDFFNLPQIRLESQKHGISLDRLDAFLSENLPKMNALAAYLEGDAYHHQTEILVKSPYIQRMGNEVVAAYKLSSLNAVLTPNPDEENPKYHAGIGMVEFARKNNAEQLIRSDSFARELHNVYFLQKS